MQAEAEAKQELTLPALRPGLPALRACGVSGLEAAQPGSFLRIAPGNGVELSADPLFPTCHCSHLERSRSDARTEPLGKWRGKGRETEAVTQMAGLVPQVQTGCARLGTVDTAGRGRPSGGECSESRCFVTGRGLGWPPGSEGLWQSDTLVSVTLLLV